MTTTQPTQAHAEVFKLPWLIDSCTKHLFRLPEHRIGPTAATEMRQTEEIRVIWKPFLWVALVLSPSYFNQLAESPPLSPAPWGGRAPVTMSCTRYKWPWHASSSPHARWALRNINRTSAHNASHSLTRRAKDVRDVIPSNETIQASETIHNLAIKRYWSFLLIRPYSAVCFKSVIPHLVVVSISKWPVSVLNLIRQQKHSACGRSRNWLDRP